MAPSQLLSPMGGLSPLHSPPPTSLHHYIPLQRLLRSPATTISMSKCLQIPTAPLLSGACSRQRQHQLPPSSSFFFFTIFVAFNSPVRVFLGVGTHFLPSCVPPDAICQHLDCFSPGGCLLCCLLFCHLPESLSLLNLCE